MTARTNKLAPPVSLPSRGSRIRAADELSPPTASRSMNPETAASVYTRAKFDSAPPIKIVHMMYEGAIRLVEQAEQLDPESNPVPFTEKLNRADAIVSELRISLEPAHAPELAQQLNALYLFVESQMREAFLERTKAPLPAVRVVLGTLLDAWKAIDVADAPRLGQTGR